MKKQLEETIIYNIVENAVLYMLDLINGFDLKSTDIEDKLEVEYNNDDVLFEYTYVVDHNERLIILVQSDQIIFQTTTDEGVELSHYVLDNSESELNEIMYP